MEPLRGSGPRPKGFLPVLLGNSIEFFQGLYVAVLSFCNNPARRLVRNYLGGTPLTVGTLHL